jgi:hypothetical protein
MENVKESKDYIKVKTTFQDLEIYVKDFEVSRKICIKGMHVTPGGRHQCPYSELETRLSLQTLTKVALRKGRYFRDEIERSENPNYLKENRDFIEFDRFYTRKCLISDVGQGLLH